ncbi:MAG: hypothetical protein LBC26_07200, partial [Oscillospiraceae bacterium]|nr:hypothetical protein [Oscillospiraceae bacterium]
MKRKLSLLLVLLLMISLALPGAAQALTARRPSGRPAGAAAVVLPDLSNLKPLPRTTNRGQVPPDKRGQRLVVSRHGSTLGCATPQLSVDLAENPPVIPAAPSRASALRLQSADEVAPKIGDKKSFYVGTVTSSRTRKTSELIAIGAHCYIYVISDVAVFVNNKDTVLENAARIAEAFDEKIYPMMTDAELDTYFGQPRDVDQNGKLTILYYDISPASTGGYFWGGDFSSRTGVYQYSNCADIVYLQSAYLTTGFDTGLGTLAHEFQHVINYSEYAANFANRGEVDEWLDEGLSELAREFYEGGLDLSRISYVWANSQLVGPGLTPGYGYINW